jgi:hypothetical protein
MDLTTLLPWRRPKLDPERGRAARLAYDETGRYAAWSAWCRAQMTRPVGTPPDGGLARLGFQVVPVLSAAQAAALKVEILSHVSTSRASKKDIDYADVLQFDNVSFLLPFFEQILSSEIDARLVAHFRSEYFIYSLSISRTMPAAKSQRSFLWHCDRGPKDFLKINLFLDATADHGSTTEFVNRTDSAALERLGYTFGPNKRRVADLAPLARSAGIAVQPAHPDVKAGEALLFEPANVLHRGILPHRGVRHMLSIMLVPSPIPWRSAWAVTVDSRVAEENLGQWVPDARNLFDMIGVAPPSGGLPAAA